jgi:hypothetical protein
MENITYRQKEWGMEEFEQSFVERVGVWKDYKCSLREATLEAVDPAWDYHISRVTVNTASVL